MLLDRFAVSQRRACDVVGIHPSTMRLDPAPITTEEAELRAWLRKFSTDQHRWRWRRAAKIARRACWKVNNKRVRRLWRAEGLRVPQRRRNKRLTGIGIQVGVFSSIAQTSCGQLTSSSISPPTDARSNCSTSSTPTTSPTCSTGSFCNEADRGLRPVRNGPEFVAHAIDDWCRFNNTGELLIDP